MKPEHELLDIVEEQHQFINELIELAALGHKMNPDAARKSRKRQTRIHRAIVRIRRNIDASE